MLFRDLKIARCLGRKDFERAIELIKTKKMNADDVGLLADIHYWSGHDDQAIEQAKKALAMDPQMFGPASLLAQIYASKKDHEWAARYARLGLENFPEPIPAPPAFAIHVSRLLSRLGGKWETVFSMAQHIGSQANAGHDDWYRWAVEYLDWYDKTQGESLAPRKH